MLLTLHGLNTDSGSYTREIKFDGINEFNLDKQILHHQISEWFACLRHFFYSSFCVIQYKIVF